jgi:hypothetical protein
MDAVFAQLADFPWFVESSDREQIERLLAAPVVPTDSFLLRPCASRKALAISYKAARASVGFELVHTRVRLDARQQMWSVDNSNRHFPTISKLVQSVRWKRNQKQKKKNSIFFKLFFFFLLFFFPFQSFA